MVIDTPPLFAGEQLDPEIVAAWLDLRGWSAAIEPAALPLRLAA